MWNFIIHLPFIVLLMSLLYHCHINKPITIIEYPNDHYDYIVVGAGTAGCVVASRLSQMSNVTVLLIEAGGYFSWLSSIPLAAPFMQGTNVDWAYKTEPQSFSSKGLRNRRQSWPRGKGLGGSGQMNYLVHSYGIPEDYKNWPKGWSYTELLPYFKKVERIMNVVAVSSKEKLAKAFSEAITLIPTKNVSAEWASSTIRKGVRWSSYRAYLQTVGNRKNLHVLIDTIVTKVIFNNSKYVDGIDVRYKNGIKGRINVWKEVILCAGAINTPQLLMLSGIGPAEELEKHRIPVLRNLPQVGKNLYDHLNVPIYVNLEAPVSITLNKIQTIAEIFKYFILGTGLLASNAVMGIGRVNNSGIILSGIGSADETLLKDISNFHTETFRALFPSYADHKHEGFIYLVSCLQPKSRGNITLKSSNISDPPKINPAYLERNDDISCIQMAINLTLRTLDTKAFLKFGAKVHNPDFQECRYFKQDYRDRNFSECIIRIGGLTSHHPGGTCKMSTENDTVVDEKLRVRSVGGLRVMDASILPSPISGTPNSVIVAMADRAADIILDRTDE